MGVGWFCRADIEHASCTALYPPAACVERDLAVCRLRMRRIARLTANSYYITAVDARHSYTGSIYCKIRGLTRVA
jgi:hypothetical protein